MTKTFLDGVYDLDGAPEVRDYYDRWAESYDSELAETGYATPARCAVALKAARAAPDAPLLDMGCGTGLSGAAFAAEGFTTIDGCDLSQGMLDVAARRRLYRALYLADQIPEARYDAVAAVGVIGAGAGPVTLLDTCLSHLSPGGHFVFSFNDHTLGDPSYQAHLDAIVTDGTARLIHVERGPHLPSLGIEAIVYILQKA